jgi:adenylosuccinate synthase
MPYHVAMDKVVERYAGSTKKIGTTGRDRPVLPGQDARIGIRVADVLDEGSWSKSDRSGTGIQEPGVGKDLQPQGAGAR